MVCLFVCYFLGEESTGGKCSSVPLSFSPKFSCRYIMFVARTVFVFFLLLNVFFSFGGWGALL